VQSKVEVLLTVFFDYCGIVHDSYAPEGQLSKKNTIRKSSIIFVMQFITPNQEFPGQMRHSSCSPFSILSWHGPLLFLVVPQIEEATEGFPF
jgi:hypothetical protein